MDVWELKSRVLEMQCELSAYRQVLRLIADNVGSDGDYIRDRRCCEDLARDVLKVFEKVKQHIE